MANEISESPGVGAATGASTASASPSPYDGDPKNLVRSATTIDHDNPHPLYVVWEVTLKCDLACKHCGSRAGPSRPDELTTDECFNLIHQMAELGVREVTLIGGEAYLREDWHQLAAKITQCGMSASMTTGARNLTPERLEQAVEAGMRAISISIDGMEATHDAQRAVRGSWYSAVEASKRVAASPIRLTTNTQINRLSMPELPALADLLTEIGSKAWQIQLTVAMGRAADRPDLLLQPHQLLELFPLLVWIKENKLIPNGIQIFPGNNIGYFGPYEELLRYGGDLGAHWNSCSAGKWTLGIEANGAIKGCPSLPTKSYTGGNIRDMTLNDIVYNTPELTHIKERTKDDLWGFCKTCYYADVCKAGCTWTSTCLLGREGNNPYCIHRAIEHEKQGKRERVVKVEQAPGEPFDNGRYEIIVEDMPEVGEEPVVADVDLSRIIQLKTVDKGLWTKDEMRERLVRK